MKILGFSAYYHDSAAALVVDGQIVAAAEEERFTRRKHEAAFPNCSLEFCLRAGGLRLSDLDAVVFYEKPFLHFDRLIETYLAFAPRGFSSFRRSMPTWLGEKIFLKQKILRQLRAYEAGFQSARLLFSEHHLSHAASAFFPSPFEDAAILTMDGVGEWATTSISVGSRHSIERVREMRFPHSVGLLYSAFTAYAGFKVNSGEYKLMGLAPYGRPRFTQKILDHVLDLKDDGSFQLNLEYFDFCTGLRMINSCFEDLFGSPTRTPESDVTQHTMDIAASIQVVLEQILLKTGRTIAQETGLSNLCMSGGVALNCVANGALKRANIFENIWIQPASGDAGGAVGAALAATHLHFQKPRVIKSSPERDGMHGAYLGPEYEDSQITADLDHLGAHYEVLPFEEIKDVIAKELSQGQTVGWFQGRMEFGPRSLGNRSILADARNPKMQSDLNLKIKNRESFRPFAPSVLAEKAAEWFEFDGESPYMLFTADVRKAHRTPSYAPSSRDESLFGIDQLKLVRSSVPAVTHVDFSARLQTVHAETNPRFHALLSAFEKLTGCPILVNTSFNVRGEPIVESPTDAFRCFMSTGLDLLVVGPCLLRKSAQNQKVFHDQNPARAFALD